MFKTMFAATVTLILLANTGQAGDYDLVMKSAIIKDSKANGKGWDAFGNAPDPFVTAGIKQGKGFSKTGSTEVDSDTFRPDWNKTVLTVDVGDDIVIQVWDKDVSFDDPIGEYKFTITKKMIEDGETRVSFEQVKELRFVLRVAK